MWGTVPYVLVLLFFFSRLAEVWCVPLAGTLLWGDEALGPIQWNAPEVCAGSDAATVATFASDVYVSARHPHLLAPLPPPPALHLLAPLPPVHPRPQRCLCVRVCRGCRAWWG